MTNSLAVRRAWRGLPFLLMVISGCGDTAAPPAGGPAGGSAAPAPGGGASKSASGPRLLFITNSNADWWNAVEKGMEDGGKEFGAQVEMRRNEGDPTGSSKMPSASPT